MARICRFSVIARIIVGQRFFINNNKKVMLGKYKNVKTCFYLKRKGK